MSEWVMDDWLIAARLVPRVVQQGSSMCAYLSLTDQFIVNLFTSTFFFSSPSFSLLHSGLIRLFFLNFSIFLSFYILLFLFPFASF